MTICKNCWRMKSECVCHLPDSIKGYRQSFLADCEWYCPKCKSKLYMNLRVGEFICKECESVWLIDCISD